MAEIRASSISNLAGTGPIDLEFQSAAKAFIYFSGGGTAAINTSLNISSLTDNGTGNYAFDFSNSFSSTDFCEVIGGNQDEVRHGSSDRSASTSGIRSQNSGGSSVDDNFASAAHIGDLA